MKNYIAKSFCLFSSILLSINFASAENIALGKPAVLNPTPNYRHCSDPEDAIQITDGKFSSDNGKSGDGSYWTQKSTVGWYISDAVVVVDLGKIEPIESVMVRSVGGGVAGVFFPKEIVVYVSDDNEHFHEVARMDPKGLKQNEREWYAHRFQTGDLNTRGRYVMVSLKRTRSMVFLDEIEVMRGSGDPAAVVFSGEPVSRAEMFFNSIGLAPESYTRGHFPEKPHVDWANPLSGKPVRAILMSDFRMMRDVVEVAQRLGVDYTPIPFKAPLPGPIEERLVENLDTCDVLVSGVIDWNAMPPHLLEKIRERIREGMGLVVVGSGPVSLTKPIDDLFKENPMEGEMGILDQIPMTRIPRYRVPKKDVHFQASTFGKGRVVTMNPQNFTAAARYLLPQFEWSDYIDKVNGPLEYWFAALNKLVLWAAHRDVQRISSIDANPEEMKIQVAPGEKGVLRVVERDPFFVPEKTWEEPISEEGGTFAFRPESNLMGTHDVNVWLLDDQGKVIDFGSGFYEVAGKNHIASIKESKSLFTPGEPIVATVEVKSPDKGLVIQASLFDTDGREVSPSQTYPVGADGKIEVSLPYSHPLTLGATLHIALQQDGKVIEKKTHPVWVEVQDPHDFTVLGWTVKDEQQPVATYAIDAIRNLGVDGYVGLYRSWRAENAAARNIRFGPENVARVKSPDTPDPDKIRVPCLNDPEYRKKIETSLREKARESRKFGAIEWSLGDEENMDRSEVGYCFSPYCLAEFRVWLKNAYGSLEALNASWETDYKNWKDVTPLKIGEIKWSGSLAPWLDHRRFMETVFAEYHARANKIIKSENPAARVGLSGSQYPKSYNGYDWWKLMHAIDHLSGYGGVQVALQRSFKQPDTFWTTFIGYDFNDDDEQKAHGQPWKVLFAGANGINYFTLMAGGLPCGLLRTDFSPTKKAAWFFPEIQELKAGVGRLFMEGKYKDDEIGIHYSPASLHVATATDLNSVSDKQKSFAINLNNLSVLLGESHYQFRFIHEEQMKAGELKKLKVLFLPWSSALSDAEANAIREFVKEGGTLIADSYTGVRDDHGKPRAMLEDVLGVRQSLMAPSLAVSRLNITDPDFTGPKEISVTSGSNKIELIDGKALGSVKDMPAFIVHPYGKGRAIFLNASFSHYANIESGGEGGEWEDGETNTGSVTEPIRSFITTILTEAGVPVPMTVRTNDKENPDIELSRFQLGDAQLVGVLRTITNGTIDRKDQSDVSIEWTGPQHIYDIRTGKYLGKGNTIHESLLRSVAKAYALLPYKVNGIDIIGKKQATPGEAIDIHATVLADASPGTHVLHMTVVGPDGQMRPLYTRNLVAQNGKAEAILPFAWNDPEGDWLITVKDAATGITQTLPVKLKK